MVLKALEVAISAKSLRQVNTTVFHLISNTDKAPLLVFLPGNPGFINYYQTYLTLIQTSYPQLEILGISHAGFSSLHGPDGEIYTLEDQIEHKINVIKHFTGQQQDREVLIFGHSVGCYMLQRVTDEVRAKFKLIAMITPTVVDIHKSKKGVLLNGVTSVFESFYYYVGYAGYMMKSMPDPILGTVFGFVLKDASTEAKEATKLLTTEPGFIRQALALGTEEMKTIRGDWQYQEHWFSRKGIWTFFAEGDHWVADETRTQLIKVIEDAESDTDVQISDEFTHSFCVSQSAEFASLTIEKLKKYL